MWLTYTGRVISNLIPGTACAGMIITEPENSAYQEG